MWELFFWLRYHYIVRKYFIIALILLTGLRSLAGDAMAMDMARMAIGSLATKSIVLNTTDSMPCHGEGSIANEADQSASECAACQVCHSPVLQTTAPPQDTAMPLASYAGQAALDWASADLTHLQKPPVS